MIFGGKTGRAIAEIKTANEISDEHSDSVKYMRKRLGI